VVGVQHGLTGETLRCHNICSHTALAMCAQPDRARHVLECCSGWPPPASTTGHEHSHYSGQHRARRCVQSGNLRQGAWCDTITEMVSLALALRAERICVCDRCAHGEAVPVVYTGPWFVGYATVQPDDLCCCHNNFLIGDRVITSRRSNVRIWTGPLVPTCALWYAGVGRGVVQSIVRACIEPADCLGIALARHVANDDGHDGWAASCAGGAGKP
jgi:hypothetical protein